MDRPSDLDEMETLVELTEFLPLAFTEGDLEEIRRCFTNLSISHAEECNQDYFGISNPEEIREDASRIEQIGDKLTVDTIWVQRTIKEYADKKERQAEEDRDWSPDDDEEGGGGGHFDLVRDAELDSMFGTLKDY